jgi:hypothetical protein
LPSLLKDFPDGVNPSKALPIAVHGIEHHIKASGPPIASRFWRLEDAKLETLRRSLRPWNKGIIERSTFLGPHLCTWLLRRMAPRGHVKIFGG